MNISAVEIKSAKNVKDGFFKNLEYWHKQKGNENIKKVLVYDEEENYPNQEVLAWFPNYHYNLEDEFLLDYFVSNRIKNKIWVRAIAPNTKINLKYKEDGKKQNRKVRIVSQEKFKMKMEISLYGKNKIGIISHKEEFAMIMKSQDIYDGLKSIFEVMWDGLEE